MIKKKSGFTLLELMTVIAILALLIAIMFPRFMMVYARARYTACSSNLKNIATALQIYSTEFERFPVSLDALVPNYIKIIPNCPDAKCDTYTAGYEVDDNGVTFTICCKGHFHSVLGCNEDEPYYIFDRGLGPQP